MTTHSSTAGLTYSTFGTTNGCRSRVALICQRIRYRPRWTLEWRDNLMSSGTSVCPSVPALLVHATVIDSNTGMEMRLTHHFPAPPYIDVEPEDRIIEWIFARLLDIEHHEAREFFHLDGRRWVDPHRDDNAWLYS